MNTQLTSIKNTVDKLKKTKEVINFAYQLSFSLENNLIKPDNIEKEIIYTVGKERYVIKRDWGLDTDALRNDFAKITRINIISFQIIVCKESYASLFIDDNCSQLTWADKDNNPDLYASQNILKCIRDALGHFKARPSELDAYGTWNFLDKKGKNLYPKSLKIKSLDITLDTVNLQDEIFDWNHIGGIQNFIAILDYLKNDLTKRLV